MCHYPCGKTFICDEPNIEAMRFMQKDVAPMGALCGQKLIYAQTDALLCESPFIDKQIKTSGTRRYAWVWAEDIEGEYINQKAHFELHFSLPKGSYATTFLESVLHRPLDSMSEEYDEE